MLLFLTKINESILPSLNVNKIIIVTGYLGLINGILRFILPLSLIYYKWSIQSFGLIYFVRAFSMSLPLALGGISTDLKGRKTTITGSVILFSIGGFFFALVIDGESIIYLIIAQVLTTVGFGVGRMGLSILIADETIEGYTRTKALSLQAGLRNFSGFIGPLLFGFLLDFSSLRIFNFELYQTAFLILGILAIGAIGLVSILPPSTDFMLNKTRKATLNDLSPDQKKMQIAFGIEEIILGFTSGIVVPFIDYYIISYFHPSNLTWGIITGFGNISIAIGSYLAGFVAEEFGKSKFVLLFNTVVPILALGIAISPSLSIVSIFYILRITTANLIHPVWESWYYTHIIYTVRGRALSLIQLSRRLSRAFGSAAGPIAFITLGTTIFPLGCLLYPFAMGIPTITEKYLISKEAEFI